MTVNEDNLFRSRERAAASFLTELRQAELEREQALGSLYKFEGPVTDRVSAGNIFNLLEFTALAADSTATTKELNHSLGRMPEGMIELVHEKFLIGVRVSPSDKARWTDKKVRFEYDNDSGVDAVIRILLL